MAELFKGGELNPNYSTKIICSEITKLSYLLPLYIFNLNLYKGDKSKDIFHTSSSLNHEILSEVRTNQ